MSTAGADHLRSGELMHELDWFKIAYTFIGGLGIFFIGMRSLSEALQALAGGLIRRIINALTSNRFMAVMVGAGVTVIVQSSSVTTVMVIGFVNAGLMELTQAIGVILGANIGTTITGWIIAIKVGKYGLLLVGLGAIPVIFAKQRRNKNIGSMIVGLGFVFLGLEFMSGAFKPLRTYTGFIELLQYFAADNTLTLWACIIVGMLLTFVIQSSSAMLGITIAMAVPGTITYQTAVALVLGENIGTTITAILASVGTNTTAKKAAKAHAVFNVFGALGVSLIFWFFIDVVDGIIAGDPDFQLPDGSKPNIATHIAAAHTLFNVVNTCLFIPLLTPLARFVTWLTPASASKEQHHLRHLPTANWSSPALALSAAELELRNLADMVAKLFEQTRAYILTDKTKDSDLEKIHHKEGITDAIQAEITLFLCKVQENRLTADQSSEAYSIIRAADELESIADYCESIAKYRQNLDKKNAKFSELAMEELLTFFDQINAFFEQVHTGMAADAHVDIKAVYAEGKNIMSRANNIRSSHRKRLQDGSCGPVAGMFFNDMIVALRKVRAHTVNLGEALVRVEVGQENV